MGSALLSGVLTKKIIKENDIYIVEPNISNRSKFKKYKLTFFKNISDVSFKKLNINIILIAVKPQIVEKVLGNLKVILNRKVLLISIVAGKNIKFYEKFITQESIIRAMPNTPAAIGKGITVLYTKNKLLTKHIAFVNKLFSAVGEVVWIKKESDMHAVTAISGSGPAYVFKFIEIMIDSAMQAGLSAKISDKLVKNTLLGSSILANESYNSPKKLREEVTSPGGTTEAALKKLEEKDKFSKIINIAIKSAIKKSIDLSK